MTSDIRCLRMRMPEMSSVFDSCGSGCPILRPLFPRLSMAGGWGRSAIESGDQHGRVVPRPKVLRVLDQVSAELLRTPVGGQHPGELLIRNHVGQAVRAEQQRVSGL